MRNDRLFLADILDSIEAIERFTAGIDETEPMLKRNMATLLKISPAD